MADQKLSLRQRITRESFLLFGLLFVGLVILPVAIYLVGGAVIGEFDGEGYGDFFGTLAGRIRNGDAYAWFMVLSPYLAITVFRLMALGWRSTAQTSA